MPLLSADEARAIMPVADIDSVMVEVGAAIRKAAEQGKKNVEVQDLIPLMSTWDYQRRGEAQRAIFEAIRAQGYDVKHYPGGHAGGASTTVSW